MNEVETVLKEVRKALGLDEAECETRYVDDGKWLCSDAYTTILASTKHENIAFWAQMHQKMTDLAWKFVEMGAPEKLPKNYEVLARCSRKPEVDIVLEKRYGNVFVVAYTDTTYPILAEEELQKAATQQTKNVTM